MNSESKKILIIEDEKPLSRALELKLIHEGFLVETLPNGEGFIDLLEKEKFSLIVCDLIMPKVDGFEVLQIIKEKKLKIPVIILTNLSQPEDEKRARDLGAVNFLVKSDTPLLKIVEQIKELVG
jgi:DNA-binding response OmpR family regulator